ncbi:MAG: hypothetical protein ACD_10C00811G0001 [uncultured bacterium]|nr:MAG: hypothetical protein ACD_10C00811G0001 [uncultured bacterium]
MRPGEDGFVINRCGLSRRNFCRWVGGADRYCAGRFGWMGRRLLGRSSVQLPQPAAEFIARIKLAQGCRIAHVCGQRCRRRQIRQIAGDRHQLFAERQKGQMVAQVLPDNAANFIGMRHDFIQRAVLRQPFQRCLRAAFGDAGDAVNGVADQRQIIDDLARRDAEFGLDTGFVEQLVAHRVVPADERADQLG